MYIDYVKQYKEKPLVWPYVKEHVYKNGVVAWCCDARTKFGGKRSFHATREAAESQAKIERIAKLNKPSIASDARAQLDASQAFDLLQRMRPGVSLFEAVQAYLKFTPVEGAKKTVMDVIHECIIDLTGKRLQPKSIKFFRTKVKNGFGSVFGERLISSVTESEIKSWLRGLTVEPTTANGSRRAVHMLFNFAKSEKYVLTNPVTAIKSIKEESRRPPILSPAQVEALLNAAVKLTPEIVPMIALNVFAGLRPEAETFRLDWQDIDMASGEIDIEGWRSKNSMSDRDIKMEPNLIAWLKPYLKKAGPIGPINEAYHDRRRLCEKEAGITDWPKDVLRHTFASMHFKHFGNAHDTAAKLGHGQSLTMFTRKYRNKRITSQEAAAFWNIFPKSP